MLVNVCLFGCFLYFKETNRQTDIACTYVGVSLSLLRMVEKPLHELGVPGKCSNGMLSLVSHLGVDATSCWSKS